MQSPIAGLTSFTMGADRVTAHFSETLRHSFEAPPGAMTLGLCRFSGKRQDAPTEVWWSDDDG